MSAFKRAVLKNARRALSRAGLGQWVMTRRDSVPGRLVEAARDGRPLPLPDDVQFEITMRCNLGCVMCHQKKRQAEEEGDIGLDGLKKIIDNFSAKGVERVKLIGGEVFLRKDISEMMGYLRDRGIWVSITTNGTLLNPKRIEQLKAHDNLLGMVFSIDGLGDVHDRIRRAPGGFLKTTENLRAVSTFLPASRITCVLQEENLEDVEALISGCGQWGVDIISFMLETFFSAGDIEETAGRLGPLGSVDFLASPSSRPGYGFSLDELLMVKKRIGAMSRKTGVLAHLVPGPAATNTIEFYEGRILGARGGLTCGFLNRLIITESGDVLGCPFIDLRMGNLLSQTIDEIWNSNLFRSYRKLLLSGNLFPICRRCCVLSCVS